MEKEQWKVITGYDDYEVSTWGNVRNVKTGRILKQKDNGHGYLQVGLSLDKKIYWISIHRLVATMFIPNPNNYDTVNHINENKHDNRVENLEWLPLKDNIQYSKHKKYKRVKCIELNTIFDSLGQAEKETGCKRQNISKCCKGLLKHTGGLHFEFVD